MIVYIRGLRLYNVCRVDQKCLEEGHKFKKIYFLLFVYKVNFWIACLKISNNFVAYGCCHPFCHRRGLWLYNVESRPKMFGRRTKIKKYIFY